MSYKKKKIISTKIWGQLVDKTSTIGEFWFTDCPFYRNPQFIIGYGSTLGRYATISFLRFDGGHLTGTLTKAHWNIDGSVIINYSSSLIAYPYNVKDHILSSVPKKFLVRNLPQEKKDEINKLQYILISS